MTSESVTILYSKVIIETGETFNPSDYEEITKPKPSKKQLTPEVALAYLSQNGYDTSLISLM